MSGELTALCSAVCYAVSYLLLRKYQSEHQTAAFDHGLFNILLIGTISLAAALGLQAWGHPMPLLTGGDGLTAIVFCALSGLAGTLLGRLALFAAIARIGATRGVIINALAPLVTLLIAVAFLDEDFQGITIAGMIITAAGVIILALERVLFPQRFFSHWFRQGITIAAFATVFQGIGYTFRKIGIHTSITPLGAAALDMGAALLGYLLILIISCQMRPIIASALKTLDLTAVTAAILTAAAIVLFFAATNEISVSEVSLITATQPVIVAMLSAVFLRKLEHLTWLTMVCAVLVTAGVVMIGL